jgi:hypothetical protein
MASSKTDITTAIGRWAVDELLERYVSWREECCAVDLSYRRWGDSGVSEGQLAYAGYLAALDREEQAARVYADHIARVGRISV